MFSDPGIPQGPLEFTLWFDASIMENLLFPHPGLCLGSGTVEADGLALGHEALKLSHHVSGQQRCSPGGEPLLTCWASGPGAGLAQGVLQQPLKAAWPGLLLM